MEVTALNSAEVDGHRMNRDELVATAALLLIAGHDTTVSLITNSLHTLQSHPDQARLVLDDESLIPTAVEEVLRFQAPLQLAPVAGTS